MAPVVADLAVGAAATEVVTLGLSEAATAGPNGVAALNQLMNQAHSVEQLTSKTQAVVQGNPQQIFNSIAQGSTKLAANVVRLSDGRIVTLYDSSTPGPLKGPTIQVMENGIKFVYRITQ